MYNKDLNNNNINIMATACKIGIVKENGTVECVICWKDGQPDAVGEILTTFYETYEKAERLIAGGHMYNLDTTIRTVRYLANDKTVSPADYYPITFKTETAFLKADFEHQYTYLFKKGSWWAGECNRM